MNVVRNLLLLFTFALSSLIVFGTSAHAQSHALAVTHRSGSILVVVPDPRPVVYPGSYDAWSAIEWATNTSYQSEISNWVVNLQKHAIDENWLPSAAAALLVRQSGIVRNEYESTIQFKIQTKDGSTITLEWDDGKLTLLSVIDQYGNAIPILDYNNDTNFNGRYDIPANNSTYAQALINYLNALGAKIVVNPSQFPIAIVCVKSMCEQQN
jgi:hypothetical protein